MKKTLFSVITFFFIITLNAQTEPTPKPPLEDFVGKYVFPDGSVVPEVDVILSGNALSMSSTAGTSALAEMGIDSFQIIEFSGIAVFKRGDDKKVNGVHIEAMGYVLDGQKKSNGAWIFTYYHKPKESTLPKE